MSKQSEYVINFVKNRKINLISLFNGKCCICGFDLYPDALEFHHVNPKDKEFPLSSNVMKSLDKQIIEAKKCVLVCSNCHRGIHAGYLQVPDNYQELFNEEQANLLLQINKEIRQGKKHYCIECGKLISNKAVRCETCSRINSRKIKRPERSELKQLIRHKPFTHIAKQFGVSDKAIVKWCIAENLPSKKSEINKYTDAQWEKI